MLQRCRLGANTEMPFDCPDDCLFFEPRSVSSAGWQRIERSDEGGLYGDELGPLDERLPPDEDPPAAEPPTP